MATKGTDSGVYRVTEIIGTSNVSWEDAAKTAVETAAKSLRDLRVAEVTKLDMKIEDGKVVAFRAKVSFLQVRSLTSEDSGSEDLTSPPPADRVSAHVRP